MVDYLKKELKNQNIFKKIYSAGYFDLDDNEFMIKTNYLYLTIGNIKILITRLESELKLELSLVNHITPLNLDYEDSINGIIDITNLMVVNPDIDLIVKSITFYDIEDYEDTIKTTALSISFTNNENIFIDAIYFQTLVGNKTLKECWEKSNNWINKSIPFEINF